MLRVPSEIVELIMDELAVSGKGPWKGLLRDLKSCCLASRMFVPYCQKHIFYSVTMQPGRMIIWSSNMLHPDYITRFSDLLVGSPHLALYVQKLNLQTLPRAFDFPEDRKLLSALKQLQNVTEFQLELLGDDPDRCMLCPTAWSRTILSLVERPQLRKLTLVNVAHFPVYHLYATPSKLEELMAVSSTLYWGPRLGNKTGQDDGRSPISLTSLTLGEVMKLLPSLLETRTGTGPFFDLSRLKTMAGLEVNDLDGYTQSTTLLEQTASLKELHLNMAYPEMYPRFPLELLHPASYTTLEHLGLALYLNLEPANYFIEDPYLGLCNNVLPNLVGLEKLNIFVLLQGDPSVHPSSFGGQWSKLDNAIVPDSTTPASCLPKLKHVSLTVLVFMFDNSSDELKEDTLRMVEKISNFVYPARFPRMQRLAREGKLKFTFRTDTRFLPNA